MENKKLFPPFIGPSYTSRAHPYDSQETINFYLESDPTGIGKNQQPAILIGTPGLRYLQTIGTGPIRATYTVSSELVTHQFAYIVSGNEVYQITSENATPILMSGNLITSTGFVSVADNGNQVIFVDGQAGYYIDIGDTTLNRITDPNFYPADFVSFQDGYFILNRSGTNIFFLSDLYSVDFPALNEEAKTGNSDLLVAAVSVSRQLYLLGTNTTEIWYDAGASGSSPFQRQDGRFSQVGCAAAGTVAIIAEQFCWLGSNAQGTGIVYTLEGSLPKRISTHAVEFSIQNTLVQDIAQSTAFAYQQEGHYFYCLNVPGTGCTWVYDMTTEQWHKRKDWPQGLESRWYGETHCLLNDVHIIGDYRTANIYRLDLDCYTDNGETKYYVRQSPPMTASNNNIAFHLLDLDFQFGVGIPDFRPRKGQHYTQYDGINVDETGVIGYDLPTPFAIDNSQPQAYGNLNSDSFTLLTEATASNNEGVPIIGMGNGIAANPWQVPPVIDITRTINVRPGTKVIEGFEGNYFFFPMKMLDKIWIYEIDKVLDFDGSLLLMTIEVRVGKNVNNADRYICILTGQTEGGYQVSCERKGTIGFRNHL